MDHMHHQMETTTAAASNMGGHHNHNMMTTVMAGSGHDGHDHMAGGMGGHHAGHDMTTGMGGMDHSGHGGMGGMDHSGHGGMGGMHMDMPGMKMYFHTGFQEYVLFEDCLTKSQAALIGACFVVFFVAVLYEGLKFMREVLLQRSLRSQGHAYQVETKLPAGSSQEQMVMQARNPSISSRMLSVGHTIQTFLHIVQVFISYCLMLVFMTYNVWLCLAVVLGAGVGYFIFGWKRAIVVDANEHCH